MPSKERDQGGGPPDRGPDHERERGPYYRAARFTEERPARRAYWRVQDAIFQAECDLSAFRFQTPGERPADHYVAVVGSPPPPELDAKLSELLAAGEPTALTPAMLAFLVQRRAQAQLLGPWVERHVRRSGGEGP